MTLVYCALQAVDVNFFLKFIISKEQNDKYKKNRRNFILYPAFQNFDQQENLIQLLYFVCSSEPVV